MNLKHLFVSRTIDHEYPRIGKPVGYTSARHLIYWLERSGIASRDCLAVSLR